MTCVIAWVTRGNLCINPSSESFMGMTCVAAWVTLSTYPHSWDSLQKSFPWGNFCRTGMHMVETELTMQNRDRVLSLTCNEEAAVKEFRLEEISEHLTCTWPVSCALESRVTREGMKKLPLTFHRGLTHLQEPCRQTRLNVTQLRFIICYEWWYIMVHKWKLKPFHSHQL